MHTDFLIRTDLATIRADKRTQIEWLDKIYTAMQELRLHVEDTDSIDQVEASIGKLRVKLRSSISRNKHVSVEWLNIIFYLFQTVMSDGAENMGEQRKDELIQLFTDFVERLFDPPSSLDLG